MKISTYLARKMLAALRTELTEGFILVYKGAVPQDADAVVDASNLLAVFTTQANAAITLGEPVGNSIGKAAADTAYVCNNPVTAGTATFFRFVTQADGGSAADAVNGPARLQGTIGRSGADMILADPVFVLNTPKSLAYFNATLPLGL